ncbi:folate-binding protein YgfZ [Avibacterium sp. 20-15]|uniref:CAF17-like 4Fe-4S cluster assembly/insertion protein YgfZ n=1 Tax=unclassified Avibacterium TaxID=2685287 RepID=UPI0020272860|nr:MULTISPECIES: folate-binding protein YgfZ [unclassified Avibacterium]MCW9733134.1 folate-binding protein YgfZ [Avibacterium sp. 20-15]URL05468.1 folate-binding protein YgfZ [Avibacterium sp. 20-132]
MMAIINLLQYRVISVQGLEAEKFLQGQLTCDVNGLADGQSTLTAHCDPKGKMSSIFRLLRENAEQFYLIVRHSLLPSALDNLKKYAVFSKVVFNEQDWQIIGVLDKAKCGAISADFCLEIGQSERAILLNKHAQQIDFTGSITQWELAEMQAGYPILSPESQNEFIPQALNLQCIEQAISFQKGCYIGQETVARAKYRGINKRAMFLLNTQTDDPVQLGSEIEMELENGWRKTGVILSAVHFEGILWLQVVMNNQFKAGTKFRLSGSETLLNLVELPYRLS